MPRLLSNLLLAACLLLTACSSDSHEAIAEDTVALMKEMVVVLEGVTDKPSAEAAVSELEDIIERMDEIGERVEAMGELPADEMLELTNEAGMPATGMEFVGQMMRLKGNEEAMAILEPALAKMDSPVNR